MKKLIIKCLVMLSMFIFLLTVSSVFAHNPVVVSDQVVDSLNRAQMVRVLIKLKDADDLPGISRMTTAKDPSHFISKTAIRNLQNKVLSEVIDRELNIAHRMENIPWMSGKISKTALEKLKNNPNIEMIIEDMPIRSGLAQSGPLIGGNTANDYGYTGEGVTVAVLDTGIDTDHPDLLDDLIHEECFLDDGCPITGGSRASGAGSAEDGDGHGTHVSGIITSSNSTYKGIAPDAGIVAVKVLDDTGNGFTSSTIAAGDWMITNKNTYGVRIINMSLGTYDTFPGQCDQMPFIPPEYQAGIDMLNAAREAGIAVFAASGNDAESSAMTAPACVTSVIAVGAVYDANVGTQYWGSCTDSSTLADNIVCFSNVTSSLDILAPGSEITSSRKGGGNTTKDGTSMASPHAAAVAALLLQKAPELTVNEIEDIMKTTGKPIYDSRAGKSFPRIDAVEALKTLTSYDRYDANQDCEIGDFELLNAIDDWADGQLEDFPLLDLIDMWAKGRYCL